MTRTTNRRVARRGNDVIHGTVVTSDWNSGTHASFLPDGARVPTVLDTREWTILMEKAGDIPATKPEAWTPGPALVGIIGDVSDPAMVRACARDITLGGGIAIQPGLTGDDRLGLSAAAEEVVREVQDRSLARAEKLVVITTSTHALTLTTKARIEHATARGIPIEFYPTIKHEETP